MNKKRYFQKLYKYDEESNAYLIEVSLDDYNDVYDDWDPSPFKRRDIEDEFNDFIFNSSEDIPIGSKICIVLHLPETQKDPKKEEMLISAYESYYSYAVERLDKAKISRRKKALSYLLLSLLLLSIGYFFVNESENVFLNVFNEGVLIGGWVFLWEFFTNVFITNRELRSEYKLYKRLLQAKIQFIYTT